MKKATFLRKYYGHGYTADMVYLDYSYRGHEYTVCENRVKGNEPLSWQHRQEQLRIDRLVEWGNRSESSCCCEDAQSVLDWFLDTIENV